MDTWTAPDEGEWTLEDAHFVGVSPVTGRDMFEEPFAEGFKNGLAPLGLPISHLAIRHVNGYPYTSVFVHDVPRKAGKPPPAFVLKILTRVHPGFRRRTKIAREARAERRPQAIADTWLSERDAWIGRLRECDAVDPSQLEDDRCRLDGHCEPGYGRR